MDFRDRARLDTSQVRDVRGRRGGGGRGLAVGGGGLGIVGLLLALVLGVNPADLAGGGTDSVGGYGSYSEGTTSDVAQRCEEGADADRDEDAGSSASSTACRTTGPARSRATRPR